MTLAVRDWGQWREPRGQDRGRGLAFMRGLMDDVEVSHGARGTQVVMRRRLGGAPPEDPPGPPSAAAAAVPSTSTEASAVPVEGVTA